MLSRLLLTLVMLVALAPAAPAATVDETDIDIKTREIAKTLRCTVCQSENIWESAAPLAHQMREVIRERVIQGQSAEEIRAYFLSRYGDYILMQPPKHGVNWLLWAGPFVALAIGGFFLYRTLGRWVAQTPTPSPEAPPSLDDQSRRRIERELHP